MTIILALAMALAAGMVLRSRWALVTPFAIGATVAAVIALSGHSLNDTPIPFLVVVCTLLMIGGQGMRSAGRPPAV